MLVITFKCISNQNHSYSKFSQIDLFPSINWPRVFRSPYNTLQKSQFKRKINEKKKKKKNVTWRFDDLMSSLSNLNALLKKVHNIGYPTHPIKVKKRMAFSAK